MCHFVDQHVFNTAMSNPNGLRSQNVCHSLIQGRTLNEGYVNEAAHWMAYFDLSKLHLAQAKALKEFESQVQL